MEVDIIFEQGLSGYSVACDNEWVQGICNKHNITCQDFSLRQPSELNDLVINRHLTSQQVVRLYPNAAALSRHEVFMLLVFRPSAAWRLAQCNWR